MGNKGNSTINIKQIHKCISSRGIKNQSDIKQTISKRISWMSGPSKALINLAWIDSMNFIVWNRRVYSCLLKIEKIKQMVESQRKLWKCMSKGKNGCKGLLKSGFYCLEEI